MTSLQPKIAAISGLVIVLAGAVQLLADGNPETNPDWNTVVAAIVLAVGLFTARQNGVTSERAGAK